LNVDDVTSKDKLAAVAQRSLKDFHATEKDENKRTRPLVKKSVSNGPTPNYTVTKTPQIIFLGN